LTNILIFKFGILAPQLLSIGVHSCKLYHSTDSETHITYTRLAVHESGVNRDTVEWHWAKPLLVPHQTAATGAGGHEPFGGKAGAELPVRLGIPEFGDGLFLDVPDHEVVIIPAR